MIDRDNVSRLEISDQFEAVDYQIMKRRIDRKGPPITRVYMKKNRGEMQGIITPNLVVTVKKQKNLVETVSSRHNPA